MPPLITNALLYRAIVLGVMTSKYQDKENTTMKKVLMIVGSMRKKSFNRQLAAIAAELLRGKAEVSFLEYADISIYTFFKCRKSDKGRN